MSGFRSSAVATVPTRSLELHLEAVGQVTGVVDDEGDRSRTDHRGFEGDRELAEGHIQAVRRGSIGSAVDGSCVGVGLASVDAGDDVAEGDGDALVVATTVSVGSVATEPLVPAPHAASRSASTMAPPVTGQRDAVRAMGPCES